MRPALCTILLLFALTSAATARTPDVYSQIIYLRLAERADWPEVFARIDHEALVKLLESWVKPFDYEIRQAIAYEIATQYEIAIGPIPLDWKSMPDGAEHEYRQRYKGMVTEGRPGIVPFLGDSTYFQALNLRLRLATGAPDEIQSAIDLFLGLQHYVAPTRLLAYLSIALPERAMQVAHGVLEQSPRFDPSGTTNGYIAFLIALESLGGYEPANNYVADYDPANYYFYKLLLKPYGDLAWDVAWEVEETADQFCPATLRSKLAWWLYNQFRFRAYELRQPSD
jgi:hypothetical protein